MENCNCSIDVDSYENNWQYARSLLCRRYIKDVPPDHRGVYEEDPDLMRFELFLNAASKRNDLSFISRGTSTSSGKMVASKGFTSSTSPSRVLLSPKIFH